MRARDYSLLAAYLSSGRLVLVWSKRSDLSECCVSIGLTGRVVYRVVWCSMCAYGMWLSVGRCLQRKVVVFEVELISRMMS